MLSSPTLFPQIGSYALLVDTDLPPAQQRAELARLTRRWNGPDGTDLAFVTFPLRAGSSGSRTVALAELIDATSLTREEQRELADLDRALKDRPATKKRQKRQARLEQLRARLRWSDLMRVELAKLERLRGANVATPAARGRTASLGQLVDTRAHTAAYGFAR